VLLSSYATTTVINRMASSKQPALQITAVDVLETNAQEVRLDVLQCSRDGSYIAATGIIPGNTPRNTLTLWRASSSRTHSKLDEQGHPLRPYYQLYRRIKLYGTVSALHFNDDGRTLEVVGRDDNTLYTYDLLTGVQVRLPVVLGELHQGLTKACFAGVGKLAVFTADGKSPIVHAWNRRTMVRKDVSGGLTEKDAHKNSTLALESYYIRSEKCASNWISDVIIDRGHCVLNTLLNPEAPASTGAS
jgi:WD40 repeat protein